MLSCKVTDAINLSGNFMARRCWANPLGGCGSLSREHVVSRSVIASVCGCPLVVSGFPILPAGRIGINSLTANILCREHNSALSVLDSVAATLIAFLRKARDPGPHQVELDGELLERWLLKTMINVLVAGWADGRRWSPDGRLVEAIFGKREIPAELGMSMVERISQARGDDGVSLTFLWAGAGESERVPIGAHFCVEGLTLFMPLHAHALAAARRDCGSGVHLESHLHRPALIRVDRNKGEAMLARLRWGVLRS